MSLRYSYTECEQCGNEYKDVIAHQRQSSDCELPDDYTSQRTRAEDLIDTVDCEETIQNVIYVIKGEKDGEDVYYVGQTIQELIERLMSHCVDSGYNVPFEFDCLDRVVEVDNRDKLDEMEGKVALEVAIDYNTTNVYGPELCIGYRDI